MQTKQKHIRNFCIISHIDHGKSTLADRFLEITKNVRFEKLERVMDSMELEKERGITIKLNTAQMLFDYQKQQFLLNLIDTPGHIDFTYEVRRSLTACEGAILLIDAAKGIQAQTLMNLKLAQQANLKIIPVINKIDLKNINLEEVKKSVSTLLKIAIKQVQLISAKTGAGVKQLMERIVKEIPHPSGSINDPLKALIFDAYYDQYQGVTALICVKEGKLKEKEWIQTMQKRKKYQINKLIIKTPYLKRVTELQVGQVGLLQSNIKRLEDIQIGDTITTVNNPAEKPLSGYQTVNQVIFANFFPIEPGDYKKLSDTIAKIKINDNAFYYQNVANEVLGRGFHCGFLGLLHLEIIQARIEKEYQINTIVTFPTVKYKLELKNGQNVTINNLNEIKDWTKVKTIAEPICVVQILTPINYLGNIMELIKGKRGLVVGEKLLENDTILIEAEMPLIEIIINFFDQLKSCSNGFASFDYQIKKFQEGPLVKLDFLVNGKIVPAFSQIIHKNQAYSTSIQTLMKLKASIPQHNFQIMLQSAIHNKIIARQNIKALKKDVTAKCYGGDITRKQKLWKKQKLGKQKMKIFGKVNIPHKVFLKILTTK